MSLLLACQGWIFCGKCSYDVLRYEKRAVVGGQNFFFVIFFDFAGWSESLSPASKESSPETEEPPVVNLPAGRSHTKRLVTLAMISMLHC